MAIQIVQITHTEIDWSVLLRADDGRMATLTYKSRPTNQQAITDVQAVFNPPTTAVTAEDGTVLNLTQAKALVLNLTPAQRTALTTAQNTIETLMTRIQGVLPTDPASLNQLRQHSPYLDWLLSLHERLGV